MAEGAPLLREYVGKTCIEGSNPSDSASDVDETGPRGPFLLVLFAGTRRLRGATVRCLAHDDRHRHTRRLRAPMPHVRCAALSWRIDMTGEARPTWRRGGADRIREGLSSA